MKKQHHKTLLREYIASVSSTPFAWGTNDCALVALGAVRAVSDRVIDLEPMWDSEESAAAYMAAHGGLEAMTTERMGAPTAWGSLGAGDIVLVRLPNGDALAVHDGVQLLAPSARGLRKIPFEYAIIGWAS